VYQNSAAGTAEYLDGLAVPFGVSRDDGTVVRMNALVFQLCVSAVSAADLFHVEVLPMHGLVRYSVLFVGIGRPTALTVGAALRGLVLYEPSATASPYTVALAVVQDGRETNLRIRVTEAGNSADTWVVPLTATADFR